MSQTEKRVEAVAALIAERRKYEGWLAALEAKRAETPDHVFFRVRSDYERRLSEILERLRSQASALNERADALNARLAALVEQERASIHAELAEIRELLGGGKPATSARPDAGGAQAPSEPPELPPDELAFLR